MREARGKYLEWLWAEPRVVISFILNNYGADFFARSRE
jgi:hypothetical protein